MTIPLYAAAARQCITPSDYLIGEFNKWSKKPYSTPHEDIYVQALVFSGQQGKSLVHVGGDLIMSLGAAFTQEVCREFGTEPSCVFYSCTHNHMVPDLATSGMPVMGSGEGIDEWTKYVHEQAMEAVRQAFATLQPARVGAGHGYSGLSANREWNTPVGSLGTAHPAGDTAHQVSVLRVDTAEGMPIAVLINSNCHAGSFFGGIVGMPYRLTGGDLAGYISKFVGNAIGTDCVPIWAIGGAGDQNTYLHSGMMWPVVNEQGEFLQQTYIIPEQDAIPIARHLASIQCLEVLEIYRGITEFSYEFSVETAVSYHNIERKKRPMPGAPQASAVDATETETAIFRFYLIRLCGIAFAGSNAESFVGLKKAVQQLIPANEVFFIELNHDEKAPMAGYVPAPRYDRFYGGGERCGLNGKPLPYNGNDVLKVYCDGFYKLVQTVFAAWREDART